MKRYWDRDWKEFAKNAYLKPNPVVVKEILKLFNPKGKKILEVGAGSGGDAITLAKAGAQISTIDISPESTKLCQLLAQRESVKIDATTGDCLHLPYNDNSFDLVYSVGLVEHFNEPLEVIKEQLRVVKPGGYLIIDVPQTYNLYSIVKKIRMKTGSYPFGWETEYSYFDLIKFGQQLNTQVIRIFGHDSAFTLKLPKQFQSPYLRLFSFFERTVLAPFFCLCIGIIIKK